MVTRWGAYVEQRLGELERGEGDYTELRQPSAATVAHARKVAAETFRDTTPTPSVVPDDEGSVLFVWHKNGMDVEMSVSETRRASGRMSTGPRAMSGRLARRPRPVLRPARA